MIALFLNSFLILGIHFVTRDDKLLGWIRYLFGYQDIQDGFVDDAYSKFIHLMTRYERLEKEQEAREINKMDFNELMTEAVGDARNEVLENMQKEQVKLPNGFLLWFGKPLFECTVCMSSIWGIVGYWLFACNYNTPWLLVDIITHCLCLAGITGILSYMAVAAHKIIDN